MTGSDKRSGDERPAAPASLATLSEYLGLSKAAISRVLNGVPAASSIPAATQERIFAAARHFHYRPNVLARSLRRGHSMMVGVLVPELSEGYTMLVLAGLEQGLLEAGYALLICSHHRRAEVVERSQTLLVERAVDGIVAIDTTLVHPGFLPVVTVSCPLGIEGSTDIVLNHQQSADLALEHLFQLGHREIAYIKGQPFSSDTRLRWAAICNTAERLGLRIRPELQTELEGDLPTHEPGYLATQRLLAKGIPFTALFAFNDISAIGAIRALREKGLSVPCEVSVVGLDDILSAAYQNPSLTTVRQPLEHMGRLAAQAIALRIQSAASNADGPTVVEPELVVRESTAACHPHDSVARWQMLVETPIAVQA